MSEEYMDEINVRILRVTEDLRAIQQELNCAAMQAPSNPELMENLIAFRKQNLTSLAVGHRPDAPLPLVSTGRL